MESAYLSLERKVARLPKLRTLGNSILTKTVSNKFANNTKVYTISGEITNIPQCYDFQFKLVEEYFNKIKDTFEQLPFFKKITETIPEYGNRAIVITKANGKSFSTQTVVNNEGIRIWRVSKKFNKEKNQYDCTRCVYDDNGIKPTIVSTWTEIV